MISGFFALSLSSFVCDCLSCVLKWVPEITHHCQKTPFLLVGTQIDLRDENTTLEKLAKNKQKPITMEQGEKLAKELKAVKFVECSALTQVSEMSAVLFFSLWNHPNFYKFPIFFVLLFPYAQTCRFHITERIKKCIRWGHPSSTWATRSTKEAKMQIPISTSIHTYTHSNSSANARSVYFFVP